MQSTCLLCTAFTNVTAHSLTPKASIQEMPSLRQLGRLERRSGGRPVLRKPPDPGTPVFHCVGIQGIVRPKVSKNGPRAQVQGGMERQ
jgi:hypothetical protein